MVNKAYYSTVWPKFSGYYHCSLCTSSHHPDCRQHTCQSCKQEVGTNNAMLCQYCGDAHHIACMNLPIRNLYDIKWMCSKCVPPGVPNTKIYDKINTVGKVPGIPVGSTWLLRGQLVKEGLHRTLRAGIAYSTKSPAYSICIQGGYEGNSDIGTEFFYTGSGGRDFKGHQCCDQELTGANYALAATCDSKLNKESGAKAKDWLRSAPVRVFRGAGNGEGGSPGLGFKFQPSKGYRYDGIYRLVKYWPEYLKTSGFKIWRFHFRRDDAEPAPWTIQEKLPLIYPTEPTTRKTPKISLKSKTPTLYKLFMSNKRQKKMNLC